MKPEIIIRCEDHPEANGRKPKKGDVAYGLRFPTEDGKELVVLLGEHGWQTLSQFVFDYHAGTPSYSDGTTNQG